MITVWVVTYIGTGLIALPYAYVNQIDAEQARDRIGTSKEMRVRELEVKQ